jgi:signal transduction histidine kinase
LLTIEIEDKGVGIPKEQQHLMFTKLFRGDNVKKLDTEGSGLGLYILKLVVDKAGGQIHFDSTEGKGSIFRVSLPLVEQNP